MCVCGDRGRVIHFPIHWLCITLMPFTYDSRLLARSDITFLFTISIHTLQMGWLSRFSIKQNSHKRRKERGWTTNTTMAIKTERKGRLHGEEWEIWWSDDIQMRRGERTRNTYMEQVSRGREATQTLSRPSFGYACDTFDSASLWMLMMAPALRTTLV